jgi:hypothetical protein
MRKPRLICIWRLEQTPDSPEVTSDVRQSNGEGQGQHLTENPAPELVCIHRKNPKACPICSRDWTQPQTGQLPYRPKAA